MSNDIVAIKQLKDHLTKQVDAEIDEYARSVDGWAGKVRLIFVLIFAAASVWAWNHGSNAKFIYLILAVVWLVVMIIVGRRMRNAASDSLVTTTTMLDLTIVHLSIVAFIQQGLFPDSGAGMYLCYFPLLAVAAHRYRRGLVIMAGLYALVVYAALSWYAGSVPWFGLSMLAATIYVFVMGSRKPKKLILDVAGNALESAFDLGAMRKEQDLTAEVHQLFLPRSLVDLPMIWCSSKHGAGAVTGGDYYQIFETERGPLVVIGDFPGRGFEAIGELAQLHQQLSKIINRESKLAKILEALNAYVWEKYQESKLFTCVIAQWEGEQMHYINAGHLPPIQMSKQEIKRLPVTCGPVGAHRQAIFEEEIVHFPARDLMVVYTDGINPQLTSDRDNGIAEIESLAEKFSGAEVNTLCHRIFDCSQIGGEPNKDDSTVVVIRRQPAAVSASAEGKGAG